MAQQPHQVADFLFRPAPILGSAYGTHTLGFARRNIFVGTIAGSAYGTHWVSLKNRNIQLSGFVGSAYGKPWVKWPDDAKLTNYALLLTM